MLRCIFITSNLLYAWFSLYVHSDYSFIIISRCKYFDRLSFSIVYNKLFIGEILLCNIVILYYKYLYDNYENFTPSGGPTQSYTEFANKMRQRGQCDIMPEYKQYFPNSKCNPVFP